MNLKLQNVRLSYPNLFEAKSGPEGGEPKYSASFLMDKENDAESIAALRDGILATAKAQWGEAKWNGDNLLFKKPDGKSSAVKVCLRDGSEKPDTAGYGDGVKFFGASNKMAIPIVDRNPSIRLSKENGRPYAGCYVNVSIRLWAQANQFGNRVNAQLNAVQFVAEGEAFGDAPVDPEAVFSNVSTDTQPADQDGGGNPDDVF